MLEFTQVSKRQYNATGFMGTCYTVIVDTDGIPTLYYVQHDDTEWQSLEDAIKHCTICDDCESWSEALQGKGLRAFNCDGEKIDFRLDLDDVKFIYIPDDMDVYKAFCEWTTKMVDCFRLTWQSTFDANYTGAHLYQYNVERDCYDELYQAFAQMMDSFTR